MQVKKYEGSAAELGLDFVVSEEVLGKQVEHALIYNGAATPVTDSNKLLYLSLIHISEPTRPY